MTLQGKDHFVQKHFSLITVVIVAVVALALGVFLGPLVQFGISEALGTSNNAISGAMVLSAALVLVFVIARYSELLASAYDASSEVKSKAESAEQALAEASKSLETFKVHDKRLRAEIDGNDAS